MSDLGYKQVKNVERRSWDKDEFASRAKARLEGGEDYDKATEDKNAKSSNKRKEEFQPADDSAVGPEGSKRAYLKSRTQKVDLESQLGKTQVRTRLSTRKFRCKLCHGPVVWQALIRLLS